MFVFILILIIVLALVGGFFVRKAVRRSHLSRLLSMVLLSVKVSLQPGQGESDDSFSEVNKFAQLLSGLSNPRLAFVFEVAVHNVGSQIGFYFSVPRSSVELVSRQIQGLWPNAQIDHVDDYTIFNAQGAVKTAHLKQKLAAQIPIRTFEDAKLDTFSAILSNFSKLRNVGEGLSMQIIARPARKENKSGITHAIRRLKQGAQMDLKGSVGDPPKKDSKNSAATPPVIDDESIKLLESKISRPLFHVDVRLLASAENEVRAEELLQNLAASFAQFSAPRHNEFKLVVSKNSKKMAFDYSFRQFKANQQMLLNASEIASIYHLPTSTAHGADVPRVEEVRGKQVHPPLNLPSDGTPIGESVFRGERQPVFITDEDRKRHAYIIGQTGTGKSSLLQNMIRSDIERGRGVAVIDPHGDLIDATLGIIPDERINDVIVFDPGDIDRPLGLNMIENDPSRPEEKTFIVNEMQSIFNKLFSQETMGPMFEQYMRNALQLLMDAPDEKATLMEVPRLFTDDEFRKRKLAKARNPAVIDFWEKEAVKVGGEASLKNMTPYITSKFNNFISNDYVRPIIGQKNSAFNVRKAMDEGKILLVNLSKGRIGDINAGLLGMVIVGKILMAALSRVNVSQGERKDFNLYIDEFQNFTTDSIATILSEARKYGLNLVIAHQFIAQLEDSIRDAVFGNVGSQIAFRVGAEDAEFLVKQFEPVFEKSDLININNFNAHVKLLISGQTAAPFNIQTVRPVEGDQQRAYRLREFSRSTYGRDREMIESEIMSRLRT